MISVLNSQQWVDNVVVAGYHLVIAARSSALQHAYLCLDSEYLSTVQSSRCCHSLSSLFVSNPVTKCQTPTLFLQLSRQANFV